MARGILLYEFLDCLVWFTEMLICVTVKNSDLQVLHLDLGTLRANIYRETKAT